MTEVEWITTDEMPQYMLAEYPGKLSERKASLASVYCFRHCWRLLSHSQRRYIEVVERLVEGEDTQENANHLWNQLDELDEPVRSFFCSPHESVISVFGEIAIAAGYAAAERQWQCDLIREIFGNPFRTVDVSPWLTSDVRLLAQGIYEEKAFDRMPILADAIQDAGCTNDDVLNHCREPREHVRGCWVIDLLLGK